MLYTPAPSSNKVNRLPTNNNLITLEVNRIKTNNNLTTLEVNIIKTNNNLTTTEILFEPSRRIYLM